MTPIFSIIWITSVVTILALFLSAIFRAKNRMKISWALSKASTNIIFDYRSLHYAITGQLFDNKFVEECIIGDSFDEFSRYLIKKGFITTNKIPNYKTIMVLYCLYKYMKHRQQDVGAPYLMLLSVYCGELRDVFEKEDESARAAISYALKALNDLDVYYGIDLSYAKTILKIYGRK